MADRRSYGQFCALASALDVLGERWTLLLIRELLIGPRRFNELSENLPGAGPNLVSDRLRSLTEGGVIERATVADDARGRVYRLTPVGESLRAPVLELAKWGLQFLTPESTRGTARPEWGFLAISAMIDADHAGPVDESYEFHVDDQVFSINVSAGTVTAEQGPAQDPVLAITTDSSTFIKIGAQLTTPFEAVISGDLKMVGDASAVGRCVALLGLPGTQSAGK